MFTTTDPEHGMDQIEKYGFNRKYRYDKPVKDLIVIPKNEDNFIFMVKTIIENWGKDNGVEILKKHFTYVQK
jgi:hypothetical protein